MMKGLAMLGMGNDQQAMLNQERFSASCWSRFCTRSVIEVLSMKRIIVQSAMVIALFVFVGPSPLADSNHVQARVYFENKVE